MQCPGIRSSQKLVFYSFGSESTTSDYDFSVYAYNTESKLNNELKNFGEKKENKIDLN